MSATEPRIEPEYNTVHNLKAVPMPAKDKTPQMEPLTRMQGGLLVGLRGQVALLVRNLRPLELTAAIEKERKGGVTAPQTGGRVSGTRNPKLPHLDARDVTLEGKQKAYEKALRKCLDALDDCRNIEADLLEEVHLATPKEARAASDLGVDCRDCHRPIACTPQDKCLAGMCGSCWKAWDRAGKPDIVGWLKQRQTQRDGA